MSDDRTDGSDKTDRLDHEPWPLRAALLLGAGILCGLLFDLLIRDRSSDYGWAWTENIVRVALAITVTAGFVLLAFTLERLRWRWSLAFAAGGGLVIGAIYYWNGTPDRHGSGDVLRFLASLLAVAIAAPLFQTMRDEGARRLPYPTVHAHSWTNVVLWCAAWGFVLVSWLLVMLLGELFGLIGIDLLKDALDEGWFIWALIWGAFGAAVGLLRDRDKVLGLLQRVVTTVLSVLAPVLAVGLVLFVLALPFTGLDVLWDKTRSPTPVVLACVVGAIILANAVLGNSSAEEARGPVLRSSAMALGAVLVPLVTVAAISTSLRIGQYGLTPSRLWGVVAVAVAAAYALFYLYALVRGRLAWADRVRPANIALAIAVCGLALLLATPLAQFGPISARSQLARLESGRVAPAQFDWLAMRFDFGPSGVRALERLKAEGSPEVRRQAATALAAANRWDVDRPSDDPDVLPPVRPGAILVDPAGTEVPRALLDAIREDYEWRACGQRGDCRLYFRSAGQAVVVVLDECAAIRRRAETDPATRQTCFYHTDVFVLRSGRWERANSAVAPPVTVSPEQERASLVRESEALRRGNVEIRRVERRQLFIDGKPVRQPFE
jgi:uncharacterized membrane protein YiaA